MPIPSRDVPQADDLNEVVRTVEAVGAGARTFQDLANILAKDPRQGRYYRRAAEILGFVRTPTHNRSVLTSAGRRFVDASGNQRQEILTRAVLSSRLIERVIPFLESRGDDGASRDDLEDFIGEITDDAGSSTIPRRVSSVVSWLSTIGMVGEDEHRYRISNTLPESVPIVDYEAVDEPLFPERHDLVTYEKVAERARKARGYLTVLIDEATQERANNAHRMLTNLTADKIRAAGSIAKRNKYIDMSTVWNDCLYLFEMKSTRNQNAHAQIRHAVSQLYEYRYLQETPSAKLVVVIENPLPEQKKWLIDYIVKDRGLLIAWDGDRRTLRFPNEVAEELRFLA
jgi:hypothetical protein